MFLLHENFDRFGGAFMDVGAKIKIMMKNRGYSQVHLAKRAQISHSGLSTIINGASSPSATTLQAIAAALNCSVSELMGESAPGFVQIRPAAVPIIGNISCGERVTPDTNPAGFADLPEGVHADFALRCVGDSMNPTFLDGDLVLIKQQPEVENGQIAAVNIDDETTLKRVYMDENGLTLRADNPAFGQVFIPAGEGITIHGLAVGYTRIFE